MKLVGNSEREQEAWGRGMVTDTKVGGHQEEEGDEAEWGGGGEQENKI